MEDCSAIIDEIHRRYRPTDSHDGREWARRTERDLVYDIVKHNHELYRNPPPALMERLKSIVASPDQIHKNSMIFHTLAQHYRLMGGADFCYSDKIRRDNDSVKHDNSVLCPDAGPGPGADVQLKPMNLTDDHKKDFSVPVLPQGPNNRMCHVLAVCSYCIGVNFPQTLDSKLNDVKFEKVTLDDLMKLYKDVKFEKVTFAAFCMDLLMQSFRASKETMATEILDDDAEVQLRMNNKNLKHVQHSTGLLADNGLDSVLVNYAFQGGAQCDEHATNFDEQTHRDPKHDSALNGGDALSNLTNILVIHGHTCVSSSTEKAGQVTIRKSYFSEGMSIMDVTGTDVDSVLEQGKSLGIKYGVLSIPKHVVCAVHDGQDWYVCDQTYLVMMKVAEFRQRSRYMKELGEFSLSAFCNESIDAAENADEKPTEYFNICSAADGNCFFNSIYLAALSMNIHDIPKPADLRSKFMSVIETPDKTLNEGIKNKVNFGEGIQDLADVFIATNVAYDNGDGAYTEHTFGTRMTGDDRTKIMGELIKLHKTPYTHSPAQFEHLWNAMADLQPLFEGMPKLHVINSSKYKMAQSFPHGHELLKNSESGACIWLKHTKGPIVERIVEDKEGRKIKMEDKDTLSHYEPFVCRHPREFVIGDDIKYFNSSMATPTTYVNIAMKYTEDRGSIVLHEHDYVGVIIREESKKCNDWLLNLQNLSGGARRMSLWPAVALGALTLLMAAAQ
jgi:hypothetical protein